MAERPHLRTPLGRLAGRETLDIFRDERPVELEESRFVDGDRESTVAEGDRPFPERRLLARRRAFCGQRFLLVKRWLRPRNTDRDKRVEAGRTGQSFSIFRRRMRERLLQPPYA